MIFISTNFLKPEDFEKIFDYIPYLCNKLDIPIGIEVFPFWDIEKFEEQLMNNLFKLREYPISFHDPYQTEHTSAQGTNSYNKTTKDFLKTLCYNKILQGHHIVYHHNNCKVSDFVKKSLQDISLKNYCYLKDLCCFFNIDLLVENAGTVSENTMLLNQDEFEHFCCLNNCKVLIDVGHAYCNKWDIEKLIYNLGNRIKAFHIHNNYGGVDSHNRINDGKINYDSFLSLCSKFPSDTKYILEYSPHHLYKHEDFLEDIQYLLSKI